MDIKTFSTADLNRINGLKLFKLRAGGIQIDSKFSHEQDKVALFTAGQIVDVRVLTVLGTSSAPVTKNGIPTGENTLKFNVICEVGDVELKGQINAQEMAAAVLGKGTYSSKIAKGDYTKKSRTEKEADNTPKIITEQWMSLNAAVELTDEQIETAIASVNAFEGVI